MKFFRLNLGTDSGKSDHNLKLEHIRHWFRPEIVAITVDDLDYKAELV